jgi:hypothetical protein
LQHFEIAVGIAERQDRTETDELIGADRLPGPVINKIHLRQTESSGLPSRIWNLVLIDEPTTCSGGTPKTRSVHGRMNSTPPPETIKVLNPLSRRYLHAIEREGRLHVHQMFDPQSPVVIERNGAGTSGVDK